MIGTSTAFGTHLAREKTIAALLPAEISRQTGRTVELYNEALAWETPHSLTLRFNDVLAAKPDMILWMMTPWDVANAPLVLSSPAEAEAGGFLAKVRKRAKGFRGGVLLQYFLYKSPSSYVRLSLLGVGGPEFLKAKLNGEWQRHLNEFDGYAAVIETRARAACIPLVAVFVPERAQAAMISMGEWPAGYDPYKLGDELQGLIVRHGGTYIDILPEFRTIPNPERGYFPVDGHPNAVGHAMIAGFLARELTGGAVPALKTAGPQHSVLEPGK